MSRCVVFQTSVSMINYAYEHTMFGSGWDLEYNVKATGRGVSSGQTAVLRDNQVRELSLFEVASHIYIYVEDSK